MYCFCLQMSIHQFEIFVNLMEFLPFRGLFSTDLQGGEIQIIGGTQNEVDPVHRTGSWNVVSAVYMTEIAIFYVILV